MQNAAATVGMAGINPAAALAMAAGGGPASAAAAANILQAHAVVSQVTHPNVIFQSRFLSSCKCV